MVTAPGAWVTAPGAAVDAAGVCVAVSKGASEDATVGGVAAGDGAGVRFVWGNISSM